MYLKKKKKHVVDHNKIWVLFFLWKIISTHPFPHPTAHCIEHLASVVARRNVTEWEEEKEKKKPYFGEAKDTLPRAIPPLRRLPTLFWSSLLSRFDFGNDFEIVYGIQVCVHTSHIPLLLFRCYFLFVVLDNFLLCITYVYIVTFIYLILMYIYNISIFSCNSYRC